MDELEALVHMYHFSLHEVKGMSLRERSNWLDRFHARQDRAWRGTTSG